ncbi:MAG: hypothetical protein ABI690_26275 [Chloroflexota bacterium]
MLPDQITNLYNIQFFVSVIMWLSLLIALVRKRETISMRLLAFGLWLFGSLLICPLATTRVDDYFATLAYGGIQHALDDQCGQGYAQAETGKYIQMSSYHWRWNGQHKTYMIICDYEPGSVSWTCTC